MVDGTESESASEENLSAGTILSVERKQQGLSLSDVARQLKLSPRQVEALERDDFAAFRGKLFVHGFLRNYARLLKIDPAPLIKAADRVLNPPPVEPEREIKIVERPQAAVSEFSRVPTEDKNGGTATGSVEVAHYPSRMVMLGAVAVVVLIVGYAARHQDSRPTPMPETRTTKGLERSERAEVASKTPSKPISPQREEGDARAKEQKIAQSRPIDSATLPAAKVVADGKPPDAQKVDSAGTSEAKAPDAVARDSRPTAGVADSLTLHMVFEQESWVEIKDVAGKTIMAQLNAAGSERTLTGNSPLSVVVGNANGVHLSINDRVVSLEPHTQFNVARVTLP
jgi:cytoskeleton protein RodZ